jgi:hypothetical protein
MYLNVYMNMYMNVYMNMHMNMYMNMYMYSPRQKSWPVTHKFNEKSYKQCQKCLLLVDMREDIQNMTGRT